MLRIYHGSLICLLTTIYYSTDVVLDSAPNDTTTIIEALQWLLSASLAPSYLRGFIRFSDQFSEAPRGLGLLCGPKAVKNG